MATKNRAGVDFCRAGTFFSLLVPSSRSGTYAAPCAGHFIEGRREKTAGRRKTEKKREKGTATTQNG